MHDDDDSPSVHLGTIDQPYIVACPLLQNPSEQFPCRQAAKIEKIKEVYGALGRSSGMAGSLHWLYGSQLQQY